MSIRSGLLALLMLPLAASAAMAQGLIIPIEPDVPPLALTRHRVTVEIDNQAAVTTVEQIFHNHTNRQLEAQYVFPIPKGAVMSRFTMLVNGTEKTGELVEKDKARQIYNSIVRRSRDPGLLELIGTNLFRANIFPIAPRGDQRITVRFQQVLTAEDSMVTYLYPVRHGVKRGAAVHGEFSIDVTVRSGSSLRNIYSPTHPMVITRKNDREARAQFKAHRTMLDKDFRLYYGVSDKDVGLNLMTFRPDPEKPGYFMMLLSPKSEIQETQIVERDVIFVIDTSGSMAGEKIKQARGALKYCINSLNDGDRFNIVRFSTSVEPWRPAPVRAADSRKDALSWVDTLIAQGGTDIAGALDAAVAFERDPARQAFIIFMTDGKPTLGETTDPRKILEKVMRARRAPNGDSIRIFSWGVGYDVDTQLLDGISEQAGGVSEYVRPEEDIEAKVSSFYAKASRPVLTGLKLEVLGEKVRLVNRYPSRLPDLYAGTQMVLFGRYTGDGDIAMRLTGRVNRKEEEFTYEGKFAAKGGKHAFIEPLWAQRRIGHLLDTIRLHGEKKELVEDVIRLSVEYGIQTPYTSYLVLEDDRMLGAANRNARGKATATRGRKPALSRRFGARAGGKSADWNEEFRKFRKLDELADKGKKESKTLHVATGGGPAPAPAAKPAPAREAEKELARSLSEGFNKKDGKAAVDTAGYLRRLKQAQQAGGHVTTFRKIGKVRYFEYRGLWVDERFLASHKVTTVKFGSEAYFTLLEKHPELMKVLKVSPSLVTVTAKGKALVISETGSEKLTDAQIEDLFRPVDKK